MYQMKFTSMLASLLFLAACAPQDVVRIKQQASEVFTLDQPYQALYHSSLKRFKQCYLDQPTEIQYAISDQRNYANQSAKIMLKSLYGKTGEALNVLIEFKAKENNQTEVMVFSQSARNLSHNVQLVKNPDKSC